MRASNALRSVCVARDGRGRHKIGSTGNPRLRAYHLRRKTGLPVEIVHLTKATSAGELVEIAAHWLLADSHIGGEWFNVTAEQAIEAVAEASIQIEAGSRPASRLAKGGRPIMFPDLSPASLLRGTLARIDAARTDGENRADFIRQAVERELKRRERDK